MLNNFLPPAGRTKFPAEAAIDAEVDLLQKGEKYFLQARLNISLPGLDLDQTIELTNRAYQTCPYSKATRSNIDVEINVI
ncbi:hypothetical protein L0657_02700 [Dyadobacter sp. CY345]|uniref:hypothetical protein n=1 Tax=Dyadobacter sp. CY345 TaxID=2909335 RepID=UPI001F3FA456|nr:hypothetical protein [Dyadobacter sp. CY345]MCF2442851.1 hypothetical protein [Dyadobacter sp. CY345]